MRETLAGFLPQPKAVEAKLASESEYFKAFNSARTKYEKATKQKKIQENKMAKAKNEYEESKTELEQIQANETEALATMVHHKKEYFEHYPDEAKEKVNLARELEAEEEGAKEDQPESKKLRVLDPGATAAATANGAGATATATATGAGTGASGSNGACWENHGNSSWADDEMRDDCGFGGILHGSNL